MKMEPAYVSFICGYCRYRHDRGELWTHIPGVQGEVAVRCLYERSEYRGPYAMKDRGYPGGVMERRPTTTVSDETRGG